MIPWQAPAKASRPRGGSARLVRIEDVRRRAVAAQGYLRKASGDASDVADVVRRLGCVQLDSIVVVERSHRLALASRIGRVPRGVESKLLRAGDLFEYWAHEACLLPIEDWPVFRRRMRERAAAHPWWGPVIQRNPALARRVLATVRRKGNVRAADFDGRSEGMWVLKPEKRMLDALWTAGRLVISGRDAGFVRRYDLPERVVPPELLRARAPSEGAFVRALAVKAVRARGALAASANREHYRLAGGARALRPHLDALARAGELVRAPVDDGGADVFLAPDAPRAARLPERGVLLSPFDNLLWDRAFAERLFGFRHVIEVYKPKPQRRFGYYAMPLLAGDRIVARADLKSDREAGVLRVRALHREAGWTSAEEDAWQHAYARLARDLGLRVEAT
jgi:uncharacterized protein YcaQ